MPKTDKSEQRSTRKSKKRDNKGFPYKKTRKKEEEEPTSVNPTSIICI